MSLSIPQSFLQFLQRRCKVLQLIKRFANQSGPSNDSANVTIELGEVFKTSGLSSKPENKVTINKVQAMLLYNNMVRIRHLGNIAIDLHTEICNCDNLHIQTGQEAVAVGMNTALRPQDCVITDCHCHGWSMLRGLKYFDILAELIAHKRPRASSCARCCGNRMEDKQEQQAKESDNESGMVRAQLSLGTSIAFACKFKHDTSVCVTLCDENASIQQHLDQMKATYKMALMWKLPAIFVCEKNPGDMRDVHNILPSIHVDGMNVLAIINATAFAMDYVERHGPIVMETNTSQIHQILTESDEAPSENLKIRDPIMEFKNICINHNLAREIELEEVAVLIQNELQTVAERFRKLKRIPIKQGWTSILDGNKKDTGIRVATEVKKNHFRVGRPALIHPKAYKNPFLKKGTKEVGDLDIDEKK